MNFETWKDDYGLVYEPNYCKGTEADCRAAFQAGAASRDEEVVSLTNQRDYEYVRAENAEQERDQLREHVKMLRDSLEDQRNMWIDTRESAMDILDNWMVDFSMQNIRAANEALAATEPKP